MIFVGLVSAWSALGNYRGRNTERGAQCPNTAPTPLSQEHHQHHWPVHFGKIWVNRRTPSCIILHHHLQPPPWPHSCPLPHLPLCFCLCHCHWEKQSLQLAVVIVLLLIRIRLISLLELGDSGPSPLLGELPQSLLFITFCSLSCVILIVKLKRMFWVFCASLRQRTSSQYLSVSAQSSLRAGRASRYSALFLIKLWI